jgi:hypothetical protein
MKRTAGIAKALTRGCLLIFAGLVMVTWAGASDAAQAQGQGPCADDVAKYCKDVQPGGGRIVRCLKQHEQELSPACKQHAAEVKKKGQEFRAACEDDVLRLCGDVKAGGGRIVHCLKQHEQELTPDCKAKMQQKKATGK